MPYNSYEVMFHMKKGEQMTEEEIKKKEEELKTKEEEFTKRESDLKTKEEEVIKREEDANALSSKMKEGYEKQIAKLTEDYDAKIKRRDDVIEQLTEGGKQESNTPKEFEALINARKLQRLK